MKAIEITREREVLFFPYGSSVAQDCLLNMLSFLLLSYLPPVIDTY